MRRKRTLALIGLCLATLSIAASSVWVGRDERLRDAWALLSRYEPPCESASLPEDAREADRDGMDHSPRAVAARRALGRETLAIVEELAAQGRSRSHRLVAASVAAAREACEIGPAGSAAAPANRLDLTDLEAHRRRSAAWGDLRFAKRRLGELLPMTDEERGRRADRYGERLADAVSREMAPWFEASPSPPRVTETQVPQLPAAVAATEASRPRDGAEEAVGVQEEPRIVIHSTSGESWSQIRSRRARERAERLRAWRPVANRALERVMRLRRALGRLLESDSLAGGADLCARLGDAARKADRAVVRDAPDRLLGSAVGRMLEGYELAGRACSEARYSVAFLAISEADDAWFRVVGRPRLR